MNLDEFVAQTLLNISKGVQQAQEGVRDLGGYVNPATRTIAQAAATGSHFGYAEKGTNVFLVDFDVAVRVTDAKEGGGKGEIAVAGFFSAGGGGKSASSNESTSRIQFKVPLALPVDKVSRDQLDEQKAHDRAKQEARIRQRNMRNNDWKSS